ncbi:MAG: glycosyltransferase family 39 protein [Chloroflexi bacterium]|nr:glycosyltransferase family 39 protein [Chloroflexota bacterium]
MARMLGRTWVQVRRHPDAVALVTIGTLALLLRLAFLYRVPVILTGDSQSHYLPGFDLIHGSQFDPELRRPPGYPVFVAATILLLGEDLRGLAFAQHLLGVGTALLTYLLGRLTFGRTAGVIAGLLVALNGALILSGQSVMTETLFTTLLLGTLAALSLAARTRQWGWTVLAGLLLGAASLTRPVAQSLVALVPVAFLLGGAAIRSAGRTRMGIPSGLLASMRGTLLVGLGLVVVMGPWMLRNLSEHGTLSAAGGLGRSLIARTIKYDEGYFDGENAASHATDDLDGQTRQFIRGKRNTIRNSRSVRSTQAGLMKEFGLTEAESDRVMRRVALAAIAEHPGYYVIGSLQMAGQITVGKEKEDTYSDRWVMRRDKEWGEQWEDRLDHLLVPATRAEQQSVETAEQITRIFQPSTVGAILPILAGVGLLLGAVAAPPSLVPGLAGLGLLLASAALDGPVPRYRYPLDPLIALFGAGAVVVLARWVAFAVRRVRPRPDGRQLTGVTPVAEAGQ